MSIKGQSKNQKFIWYTSSTDFIRLICPGLIPMNDSKCIGFSKKKIEENHFIHFWICLKIQAKQFYSSFESHCLISDKNWNIKIETRLLVSGQSPECSDCVLRFMEQQ